MGHQPTRKRKRILLHITGCLIGCFIAWGCAISMPSPRSDDQPGVMDHHLAQAELMLVNGDYDTARRESCLLLEQYPGQAEDRVLYLLGMVWVHPENPHQDIQRADTCFRRIVDGHPQSPLIAASEIWLAMIARLEENEAYVRHMQTASLALEQQLETEKSRRIRMEERLNQMKAVDLDME